MIFGEFVLSVIRVWKTLL